LLLFRTHQFSAPTRAFCERLIAESGLAVTALVDESRGAVDLGELPKIGVSSRALSALGLHLPKGFQWRCGDYGLYLAAQAFPEVEHFWLVEYDVRIHSGEGLGAFFSAFQDDDSDLIAPMFGERGADWWWSPAMASGARPVYGCLFPILRVSARLVGAGLEGRRRIGRSPVYRLFWPNDESFLATEAMRQGFRCRDFNADGRLYYSAETFSFEGARSGAALEGTDSCITRSCTAPTTNASAARWRSGRR
jgi:hypothetical protein